MMNDSYVICPTCARTFPNGLPGEHRVSSCPPSADSGIPICGTVTFVPPTPEPKKKTRRGEWQGTAERRDKAFLMYAEGHTIDQIMKELNVSKSTVERYLKDSGAK